MCRLDDVVCWKSEMSEKFRCGKNDINCWKDILIDTPCKMDDI